MPSRAWSHYLAGTQPVRSVHHYALALLQSAVHNGDLAFGKRYFYWLKPCGRRSFGIRIDSPNKGSLQAGLYRRRRNHQRVGPVFKHQVDVDKLVGE